MSLYSYEYEKAQKLKISKDQRVRRILIHSTASLASLFLVLLSTLLLRNINSKTLTPISLQSQSVESVSANQLNNLPKQAGGTILGEKNVISPTLLTPKPSTLTPSISVSPSSKPGDAFKAKKLYTIAIIGDSMVDTMGEVLEYLDSALKKKYPNTKFLLYNFGTGAQNVEAGLNRFGSRFDYQSRHYQSIPELKPDILIVASFSYNPFTPHDRDRHWLTLTKLVETALQVTPRVYMLSEIAPLRQDFGKGPQGVNWSNDTNYEHSLRIIQQLENSVGLSKTLGVTLIDAFTPSFNSETREGKRQYVNPSDGIHPSVEGHKFMAEKIAQTIILP